MFWNGYLRWRDGHWGNVMPFVEELTLQNKNINIVASFNFRNGTNDKILRWGYFNNDCDHPSVIVDWKKKSESRSFTFSDSWHFKMELSFQDFTSSTVIGFEMRLEEDHWHGDSEILMVYDKETTALLYR